MSRPKFRATPLALATAFLFATTHTHAQNPIAGGASAAQVRISIAAQPLAEALNDWARQTRLQLIVEQPLVNGKSAPAVAGDLTPREALDRLLAGSGLVAVSEGSAVVIKVAPRSTTVESVLPAVMVVGNPEPLPGELPKTFAGGQVARGSRLGMLGNTDVFDTPFSTKAYTAELLQNQGARNLNDVVVNDPSIRTSLSPILPLDQGAIRGFVSDGYLFDGMANLGGYSGVSVQNFERVEILKGPSAALGGSLGSVGGSFNLVPKRATDAPVRSATLSVADKSLTGVQVDLGGRFGTDNVFGARLNVSAENGDLYNGAARRSLAPQIALDYRGEQLRVMFDAGSIRFKSSPSFSQFILLPGATLPRVPDPRVVAAPSWDTLEFESAFGLLTAEWGFSDRWTVYARYGRYTEEPSKRINANTTPVDSSGDYTITGRNSYLWKQDNDVAEVGLRGQFQWGDVKHQLAVNALYNRLDYHDERYLDEDVTTPVVQSIYRQSTYPNPFSAGIPFAASVDYAPTYINSVAIADTLSMLDDRLKLTLSLRQQSVRNDTYDQQKTTPTVGALYKLGNGFSVYGNYAQALTQGETAPLEASNANQQLAPYVSKQKEAGVKFDGGSYGVTAAVFEIRQAFAFIDSSNVFRAGGLQTNRGVELEAFGEPVKGFRPLGGVAWIDARQSSTEGGATDGKKAIGVPAFTANLGAELDVPALPDLTLTGRVIHTGSAFVDLANSQRVPAWNRLDVGARYRTQWSGQALTLRMGVDNLLDKSYFAVGGRNIISIAPPRTWRLSATMTF